MKALDSNLAALAENVERVRLEQRLLIETVFAQGKILTQIHAALHPEEPPQGESATALLKELIEAVKSMHDDLRTMAGSPHGEPKAGSGV